MNGNTVWEYTVTKVGNPQNLSHLSIEICHSAQVAITASPSLSDRGQDGSLGLPNVLKWEANRFSSYPATITVTYAGLWATGSQTGHAKAGQTAYVSGMSGPSCTALTPTFTVTKTVSATETDTGASSLTLNGGGTAHYFYTITNTGHLPFTVDTAEDDKLGALTFSPLEIQPGGTATAFATKSFPALAPGAETESETNTVSVTVRHNGQTYGPQTDTAMVQNVAPAAAPAFLISKTVSTQNDPTTGQSQVTLTGGGLVHFFYQIINTGNVPLVIGAVSDDKISGLAFGQVVIPAGETATAMLSKTFDALHPDALPETEVNTFTATVSYNGEPVGTQTATATVVNNPPPDEPTPNFAVTKLVSTSEEDDTGVPSLELENGGVVYYHFSVHNSGSTNITITSATDDVYGTIALDSYELAPGETARGMHTQSYGTLPAGDDDQIVTNIFTVVVQDVGTKTATATVTNKAPEAAPAFTVTKQVSATNDAAAGQDAITLNGGGSAYYFYTITNTGNVPLALDTAVDDILGDITFDEPVIQPGQTVTATASKTFPQLAPGAQDLEEVNEFSVTVLYREEPYGPKTATAKVTVEAPAVQPGFLITKTVSITNNPATGQAQVNLVGGGTAYYFYKIINTGNVPLTIEAVSDDKVPGLAFTPSVIPVGGEVTATLSKNFGSLPSGTASQTETNIFSATVSYGGENLAPKQASATVVNSPVPVQFSPNFIVSKSVSTDSQPDTGAGSVTLQNGGVVYYFFTVTNTGNTTINITDASDDKLGPITLDQWTLGPGQTARATVSKSFGALPAGSAQATEVNIFTARAFFGGQDLGTRTAQASVVNNPPTAAPSFEVTKTVSASDVRSTGQASISLSQGGTAYYFYTIQNTGNVPLVIGSAIDDKLGPVQFDRSVIPAGESATATMSKTFAALSAGTQETETNIITVEMLTTGQQSVGTKAAQATVFNATVTDPRGTVTVRVLDNSPRNTDGPVPIANATVTFTGGLTGLTDQNGEIFFTNLAFGTYEASAEADDPVGSGGIQSGTGVPAVINAADPDGFINILLSWPDDPLVGPGESDQSAVSAATVDAPGEIAGRICSPKAPGAQIVAIGPDGKSVSTTIAADGILGVWRQYSLKDLLPGAWTLTLNEGGRSVSQNIEVLSGETVSAADFTLACTGQGGSPSSGAWLYFLAGGLMVGAGLFLRRRQSLLA